MIVFEGKVWYNQGSVSPIKLHSPAMLQHPGEWTACKEAINDLSYHESESITTLRGALMATSKMQRAFSQAVYFRFDKHIIHENHRPAWLLTDVGDRMELDFWFPEIGIAVEIQGNQHYTYTPHFHADYQAFQAQLRRDELKRQVCDGFSIRLLEVYDQLTFEFAVDSIEAAFKSLNLAPKKSPAYWLQYMKFAIGELDSLYRHRTSTPFPEYASKLNKHKTKLQGALIVHGIESFEQTDSELAQKMFYLLLRNMNWYKQRKTNKRRDRIEANKDWKSRKADSSNGGQS